MNKTIYKCPLEITDTQTISLPFGYEILTIQAQNDVPCLWVLVNPDTIEKEEVEITFIGTGHPISYDMGVSRKYITTIQMFNGGLVIHAFQNVGI